MRAGAENWQKKLKDSSMRNRLQEYSFVIETVILADESYSSADYEAAEEYYLSALDRTRYADNVGTDYIENKLEEYQRIPVGGGLYKPWRFPVRAGRL